MTDNNINDIIAIMNDERFVIITLLILLVKLRISQSVVDITSSDALSH